MEYLFIYLLQTLDVIQFVACVIFIVFIGICVALIINCIATFADCCSFIPDKDDIKYESETYKLYKIRKGLIKTAIIAFVLSSVLSFIPTKQTLLFMGGTYLGKKAVNAVATDEKIKKVDTIINLQLDKYIKELQKGNN